MKPRKLHPITKAPGDKSVYCGPAAVMALTGKTHAQAQRAFNRIRRHAKDHYRVRSATTGEIVKVLLNAGVEVTRTHNYSHISTRKRPTFARWLRERQYEEVRGCFVVLVTGHVMVVRGNEFIDNFTKEPVKVDDAPHRRTRVQSAYWVGEMPPRVESLMKERLKLPTPVFHNK